MKGLRRPHFDRDRSAITPIRGWMINPDRGPAIHTNEVLDLVKPSCRRYGVQSNPDNRVSDKYPQSKGSISTREVLTGHLSTPSKPTPSIKCQPNPLQISNLNPSSIDPQVSRIYTAPYPNHSTKGKEREKYALQANQTKRQQSHPSRLRPTLDRGRPRPPRSLWHTDYPRAGMRSAPPHLPKEVIMYVCGCRCGCG
jgi:hypothetical protein